MGNNNFRLLHIDIETTPAVVYTWQLRKQDIGVDQIITPTSLLCFSAKWHGQDDSETIFFKSVKQSGKEFDRMVKAAHELLSQADAVCHYNGKTFDIPRLNQEFLRLGLAPPPNVPQIDMKVVVMSKFSMVSSKLAFVGPYLKIGEKVRNEGWPLWVGCLEGDKECWQKMEAYNRQDVLLLEKLYAKLVPWIDQHPNLNHYVSTDEPVCPNCGSEQLQRRGMQFGVTLSYRRLFCRDCGKWSRERSAIKMPKKICVR